MDILNQFLVESSMLSATGGLIGVLIAWIVAVLVRSLTPVPMCVPATAVLVGVSLSAVVGLFFGIYPAQRAAQIGSYRSFEGGKMSAPERLSREYALAPWTPSASIRCARSSPCSASSSAPAP